MRLGFRNPPGKKGTGRYRKFQREVKTRGSGGGIKRTRPPIAIGSLKRHPNGFRGRSGGVFECWLERVRLKAD